MELTEKIIYITEEMNSDETIIKHNGLSKIGIGETTRELNKRFREHTIRGSKSSVGVDIKYEILVNGISDKDIHKRLIELGYFSLKRHSVYDKYEVFNRTEVFSGVANRTIDGIV